MKYVFYINTRKDGQLVQQLFIVPGLQGNKTPAHCYSPLAACFNLESGPGVPYKMAGVSVCPAQA